MILRIVGYNSWTEQGTGMSLVSYWRTCHNDLNDIRYDLERSKFDLELRTGSGQGHNKVMLHIAGILRSRQTHWRFGFFLRLIVLELLAIFLMGLILTILWPFKVNIWPRVNKWYTTGEFRSREVRCTLPRLSISLSFRTPGVGSTPGRAKV